MVVEDLLHHGNVRIDPAARRVHAGQDDHHPRAVEPVEQIAPGRVPVEEAVILGAAPEPQGEPLRDGHVLLPEQAREVPPTVAAPDAAVVVDLDPEAAEQETPDVAALAQHVGDEHRDEGAWVLPGPQLLVFEPPVRPAPSRHAVSYPRVGPVGPPRLGHAPIVATKSSERKGDVDYEFGRGVRARAPGLVGRQALPFGGSSKAPSMAAGG